jgi:gamma-glutamylcyclotransferase (GGCT)/AIG2-like uncharacterized protein YtfP
MKMSQQASYRLAVYGTLGPGRPNHHQVSMLRGDWTTGFPGLVLGDGEEVRVELLHSEDLPEHWERLDAFEGEGYQRVTATVRTEFGLVEAFIYVLAER